MAGNRERPGEGGLPDRVTLDLSKRTGQSIRLVIRIAREGTMKVKTAREMQEKDSKDRDGERPPTSYNVHYPVTYDVGAPYTVLVD